MLRGFRVEGLGLRVEGLGFRCPAFQQSTPSTLGASMRVGVEAQLRV